MPDYKLSKIYSIRSHQTEEIYIGSTTQSLAVRLAKHKTPTNKYCSSTEILKYPDAYIELIELFPCNSKEELNRKEGEHIRSSNCVNKNIAGRTREEHYQDNKDKLLEQQKEYDKINKDKIAEYKKEYYQDNRNKILEQKKEYEQINKEKIAERQKQYRLRKKQSS